MGEQNYYALLGIPADATYEEIRHAYRMAALHFHPDTRQSLPQTELFIQIQQAYEVLSIPQKRAEYDASLPAEAKAPPVQIHLEYSRPSLVRLGEPQLIYTLLEVTPQPDTQPTAPPALNVCLVIDCSTSMRGAYMDTVKSTAIELIRQMHPQDILSLVAFNDTAHVILPGGAQNDPRKMEIQIQMLHSEGGTEIFRGLNAGYNEVRKAHSRERINHIILLTDGRTYGDEEECIQLASQAEMEEIGISALGIGNKWHDSFLDQLTSQTGGHCLYVSSPKEVAQSLKDKMIGLRQSYADQTRFDFKLSPDVSLNYAFRIQPETTLLSPKSPLNLGRIPIQGPLTVLLEFLIGELPLQTEKVSLASGLLSVELPGNEVSKRVVRVNLERPVREKSPSDLLPAAIAQALSRVSLYRMQEQVQNDLASGNIKEANTRLQFLATNLFTQGETQLAQLVLQEAVHLQNHSDLTEEGKKRIKYGTRALILEKQVGEVDLSIFRSSQPDEEKG